MCLVDEHPHKATVIVKYAQKLREDMKNKLENFQFMIKDFDDVAEQISQDITQKKIEKR